MTRQHVRRFATWALLLCAPLAMAAEGSGATPLPFAKGASSAHVDGSIHAAETMSYTLQGHAGQTVTATLKTDNPNSYFKVFSPDAGAEPIFIGARVGPEWTGKLPKDGQYTFQVYLVGYAVMKQESAKYTLTVDLK